MGEKREERIEKRMERGMSGKRRGRKERRVFVSYFTVVIKHLIKTT